MIVNIQTKAVGAFDLRLDAGDPPRAQSMRAARGLPPSAVLNFRLKGFLNFRVSIMCGTHGGCKRFQKTCNTNLVCCKHL